MINEKMAALMTDTTPAPGPCPTVTVLRGGVPVDINESDYDSSTMELYKDKK